MAAGQEPLSSGVASGEGAIQIRVLESLDEFRATLEVQSGVWGFSETDQVPPRILSVARHIGGLVLGAYDGERLIGFSLSFPGVKPDGQAYWHSHMTGVLAAYQNRQIGRQIKLRQRREAVRARIGLVEWMFDPLEIRNAHFNIERLGVIVRQYLPNLYGITSSPLHGGIPTDRLAAEWHVNSPRVKAITDRGEAIEKRVEAGIEIPGEAAELRTKDPDAVREIQTRVRGEFERHFARGLAVVGYRKTDAGGAFELGRLEDQPVAALL